MPTDPPAAVNRYAVAEGRAAPDPIAPVANPIDDREIECIAKIVVHEAGNQPLRGQIAVAQVVRTRMRDGRFAPTACGVARQRGQFFDVDAYDPPRGSARWSTALKVAYDTLNDDGPDLVRGAVFFRSDDRGVPGRVRVARIANHVFFR